MITVEQVARDAAGLVGFDMDLILVGRWVVRRWQEVANGMTLMSLRRLGELIVPGTYSTGSVGVTRGSTAVTGTGTSWTAAYIGRHMRISQAWYRIAQVSSATSIILESEYAEATVSDAGYTIAQRYHTLEPDVRKMGMFLHMGSNRPLRICSQVSLDLVRASRSEAGGIPAYVVEQEPDIAGLKRVEIYPYPTDVQIVHYVYWARPPELGFKDYLPGDLDIEALREGALVDIYRYLANRFAQEEKIEAAAYYRNEARSQETAWHNRHKKRLLQQDDALDDLEFLLQRHGAGPMTSSSSIQTAYDAVWNA